MTAETALHRWVQKTGIIQGGSSQLYALRKLFRPELYQGKYRRRRYFEGWYYKLIPAHRQEAWAVIAGVALGESRNERHAFIQLMDGAGRADYFTYPFHAFTFDPRRFVVHIGPNRFSDASLELALQGDQRRIQGAVRFSRIAKLHWRPWNPGIMGPFSFVPGMECYHGIVNLHHELQGQLLVAGAAQAFDAGYGYLEKDWGRSFPESWIWLQCNHFAEPGVSFMLSMAKIPWLGRHFLGIISCLRRGGREYRCATYTGGRVTEFSSSPDRWQLVVQDRRLHLQVDARCGPGGILRAPHRGQMSREILETLAGEVTVSLTGPRGEPLFAGTGAPAGMERVEGIDAYVSQHLVNPTDAGCFTPGLGRREVKSWPAGPAPPLRHRSRVRARHGVRGGPKGRIRLCACLLVQGLKDLAPAGPQPSCLEEIYRATYRRVLSTQTGTGQGSSEARARVEQRMHQELEVLVPRFHRG